MSNTNITAVFDTEPELVQAIKQCKEQSLTIAEIYTPYPVHEAIHAVGKPSNMITVAYFYGLIAASSVLAFLYYTSVISWPIVYGGKPFNSFPSFIVVTLILTIASITILSLFTFSVRAKLFPGQKANVIDPRATDNKFVMILQCQPQNAAAASNILKLAGATEISTPQTQNA